MMRGVTRSERAVARLVRGTKKPAGRGLSGGDQAMMPWYLLRVCPALPAVCVKALALVGVPVSGWVWLAHCCASCSSLAARLPVAEARV
ncbi:hypothetical protein SAMN03159428_01834 [Kosakonia radicincitans]|uniref:Uncharacterized protein n=1 Tax=Kosakonia radicincitans TaxID=283686 RepID=A0AAX2EQW9_9ENTR|nr:hypothetical protein SAMN03159468_00996 [Kosakonia radicincitans]SFR08466.1 hypothetical protein SAMN03159514_01840 [Kosakonia radicincitans]SFT71659.1 hypothetical protein SAMN03159428_01834 [Kosakonia radicincitans]SFX50698.1 hypothetical protein SAMN03159436_01831 [Kosakonia radicincitans]